MAPLPTSSLAARNCCSSEPSRFSSISALACQIKEKGEIVAPRSATALLMLVKLKPIWGTKVLTSTAHQLAWVKKELKMYAMNTKLMVRKIFLKNSKLRKNVRYHNN